MLKEDPQLIGGKNGIAGFRGSQIGAGPIAVPGRVILPAVPAKAGVPATAGVPAAPADDVAQGHDVLREAVLHELLPSSKEKQFETLTEDEVKELCEKVNICKATACYEQSRKVLVLIIRVAKLVARH